MRALVLEYYFVLRSVLDSDPHLRPCLTRCRHCRIFFLTDPRNRGRHDLSCPFGCRDTFRQRRSTERSTAYYSTPHGKWKKKLQNNKRCQQRAKSDCAREAEAERAIAELDEIELDAGMVEYVRVVTSLIEGWRVSREQTVEMLKRTLRQHSMVRERRIDYFVRLLKANPP